MQRFFSTMILQDAGIGGECFQKVEYPASDPVSGNAFYCVNILFTPVTQVFCYQRNEKDANTSACLCMGCHLSPLAYIPAMHIQGCWQLRSGSDSGMLRWQLHQEVLVGLSSSEEDRHWRDGCKNEELKLGPPSMALE